MDLLFGFVGSVADLIDALYIFFCLPLNAVPHALFTTFYSGRFPLLEKFFSTNLQVWMIAGTGLADFSLAELLLGGGLAIFLLWRIVTFLSPSIV